VPSVMMIMIGEMTAETLNHCTCERRGVVSHDRGRDSEEHCAS